MNRKSFIKSFAALSAVSTFFSSSAFASNSAKNKKSNKPNFESTKKIFKTGKVTVEIKIPKSFKGDINNIKADIICEDGAWDFKAQKSKGWATDYPAKISHNNDSIFVETDCPKECRYSIRLKDKLIAQDRAQKSSKNILAIIPFYALEKDLYELRPFKGDTHIHTTKSDGSNTPEEVALRCYEIGLDYQGISDHSVYETSEEIKQKFANVPTSMAFFNAEECHESRFHIQNLGGNQSVTKYIRGNKKEFDKLVAEKKSTMPKTYPDYVREIVAKSEVEFDLIHKFGGLAVFNHPYWQIGGPNGKWTYLPQSSIDLMTSRGNFDVYEIVNGRVGIHLSRGIIHYYTNCPNKPVIGCTDAHHLAGQGIAYTIAFAKSNKFSDIKEAILSNRTLAISQATKKQPIVLGKDRLVSFAYFLLDEYFPKHDELVAKEGELIKKALAENSTNYLEIQKASDDVNNLYASMLG